MGKKVLSFLMAILMLASALSLTAFAEGIETDGEWKYVISEGGAKAVAYSGIDTVASLPEKLGAYTTVSVGEFAFKDTAAEVVNLPECIKSIEENAFSQSSVKSVYIPFGCEDISANAADTKITVYGFRNTAAYTYAADAPTKFVALTSLRNIESYVGKSFTIASLQEDAVLTSLDNCNTVSGATVSSVAVGTGKIKVSLPNGIVGMIEVTVKPAPQSITNVAAKINLYIGNVYKISPKISNGEYNEKFTFKIDNSKIASIDSEGKVTALSCGSTTIRVSYPNGISATAALNVGLEPANFNIDYEDLVLGVGEPATLTYTLGENEIVKKVYFTSSNEKIATVNAKGAITTKKVGAVTITATTDTGIAKKCIVTVGKAPTSIKLAKSAITIGVGEKVKYKASVNSGAVCSTFLWRSGDTSILSVDANGVICGKKAGKVKLYAYTYNYKSKNPVIRTSAVVTVKKAPSSASFNKSSVVLGVGEKYDFSFKLPANTASYKTTTAIENTEIATVGKGIVVTAKALGETQLTTTTFNGKKAVAKITVKPAPEKVACKPTTVKLALKQKYQLSPYVNKGAVCSSYTYKTSNKNVCTVSAKGVVTAKDYGSCWIYIYTYNHTSKNPITCKVKFNVGYITNKVSSYTTYFDANYYGKSVNLKMACKYINGKTDGYILQPGQTFSFNGAVGPRTRARGFTEAKVIVGGDYVDGLGGGICQAASTIFNTTLLGNFSIVERYAHNLKSSYVPVGRDATVSWGSQDYKFRNNYDTPIRIKMNYNANGTINCTIYSLKKVKLPKISLKVTYKSGTYTLKRYADGNVNYTTISRYAN